MKVRTSACIVCVPAIVLIACAAVAQTPCFPTVAAPPWTGEDVGQVQFGASKPVAGAQDVFQLCSGSMGFGKELDSFRFLFQKARADFEVTVRVDDFAGQGMGGLIAYSNWRIAESPFAGIFVETSALAGPRLISLFREEESGEVSQGRTKPVQTGVPVFLKIRRTGSMLVTSFSRDGKTFEDHLQVDGSGGQLGELFLFTGMMQTSGNLKVASSVFFSRAALESHETDLPPRLDLVTPPNSPLDGGVQVSIRGASLAETTAVTLAGVPAKIVSAKESEVVVTAGPAPQAGAGAVEVTTKTGSALIENAFVYVGKLFVRGSFKGGGKLTITDPISMLEYFFLGGAEPICPDALDANGDDKGDLADPIYILSFLFLGGKAPPAPYPNPGLSSVPCGLPPAPIISKLSSDTIREGDLVTISGRGFPENPEAMKVFFGDSSARVVKASGDQILVEVGQILNPSQLKAQVSVVVDFGTLVPLDCRLGVCLTSIVGLTHIYAKALVSVLESRLKPIAVAKPDPKSQVLILDIDPRAVDTSQEFDVIARLNLPVLNGLSRGSQASQFEFRRTREKEPFADWLQGLADRLQDEFSGGGLEQEVSVRADAQGSRLLLQVNQKITAQLSPAWLDSIIAITLRPAVGRCGPSNLHPVNDRRAFGWCRFEELISTCGGWPAFQYFIPVNKVFTASSSIFPLPHPNDISPSEKGVMYNKSAYCFARKEKLYKQCTLNNMISNGFTQVPHFPRSAIVVKTAWKTTAQMDASGKDKSKHYSYVYSGDGKRYYLVALHFTTKDVDKWYWADFYVPTSAGFGGCEGFDNDRPASITGVWTNYKMCTNLEETDTICGNFIFPECGNNTCVGCHKVSSNFGSLFCDFLPSIPFDAIGGPCP